MLAENGVLSALSSDAEMAPYSRAILAATRNAARNSARTKQTARIIRPLAVTLVEHWLTSAERIAEIVDSVLRSVPDEIVGSPEEKQTWQICLVAMSAYDRALKRYVGGVRKEIMRSSGLSSVWKSGWDRRYEACLDRIDDLCETISLGLNDETRAGIVAAMSEASLA